MKSTLEIVGVPALSDNYVWLVHDAASGETVAIDPGEAAPVLSAARLRGWAIDQVWNTHWHPDHTAGNAAVKAAMAAEGRACPITGPAAEAHRIAGLDRMVAEGDVVTLGAARGAVWETPAHTAGHISYHFAGEALLFPGDTMFAMGCGRLFEGDAAQMHASLQRFAGLPDATRVYSAHEYTRDNAGFAVTVDPGNRALRQRLADVTQARAAGDPTLPTTIGLERATNPFLRVSSAEGLAALRQAKDAFRG